MLEVLLKEEVNLQTSVKVIGCVLVAIPTIMPVEILAEIVEHQEVMVKVLEVVDVDDRDETEIVVTHVVAAAIAATIVDVTEIVVIHAVDLVAEIVVATEVVAVVI